MDGTQAAILDHNQSYLGIKKQKGGSKLGPW